MSRDLQGSIRSIAAVGAIMAAAGIGVFVASGHTDLLWPSFPLLLTVPAVFLAVFAWLVAPRQRHNPVVAVMAVSALLSGVYVLLSGLAVQVVAGDPVIVKIALQDGLIPAHLPRALAWLRLFGDVAGTMGVFLWITFGLLLFPDGRLPSPKWRWVARATALLLGLVAVGWSIDAWPTSTTPTGEGVLFNIALIGLLPLFLTALASLAVRLRRSVGAARQEFKWVVWGASFLVPGIITSIVLGGTSEEGVALLAMAGGEMIAITSYGIAVGRYRLFDIDTVISRTVAYGAMAVFITAIYVVIAVVIGGLVGGSSLWLSIVATAVVAIAFEFVRVRVQAWANRLVYGARVTPYEALSEIASRLSAAESEEGLLERMASMLRAGTGATRAGVWLVGNGRLTAAATEPAGGHAPVRDLESLPGEVTPIEHDGDLLGALTVEKDRGDTLNRTEQDLVEDLAGSAALVLRKLRLDSALESKATQLQDSRRHLVDAQDIERRHLERELHDGAQQRVVALKVKLGVARQVGVDEGLEAVVTLIDQMSGDTQLALEQIRMLARGVYPPLLQSEGLAAAIAAVADTSSLDVLAEVALSRRYPLPIEGAIYFCITEAVTNASKHARGPVSVHVDDRDGEVTFSVTDSGPGFDLSGAAGGSGLRNMADRLEALGGTLAIVSSPGQSTRVTGSIPVPT